MILGIALSNTDSESCWWGYPLRRQVAEAQENRTMPGVLACGGARRGTRMQAPFSNFVHNVAKRDSARNRRLSTLEWPMLHRNTAGLQIVMVKKSSIICPDNRNVAGNGH